MEGKKKIPTPSVLTKPKQIGPRQPADTNFVAKVVQENQSLKIYIPKGVAEYLRVKAGKKVAVRIISVDGKWA